MTSSFLRTCQILTLGLIVVLASQSAWAQKPPAAPSRPGGTSGQGRSALVLSAEVQKELGLNQKQEALIKRLTSKLTQKQREMGAEEGAGGTTAQGQAKEGTDPQAKTLAMTDLQREVEVRVCKVLNKRQKDRLVQLEMQRMGSLAVLRKDTASKLKLTSAQNKNLKAIVDEMQAEMARSMPQLPNTTEDKGVAPNGAPAGKGNSRRGNGEGQGGAVPNQGAVPGGEGIAGGPMVGYPALGNFFFPTYDGGIPGDGGSPGGATGQGSRPNLDTPEFRAQIAKMREAHAKIRESTTKKIDEILTKEQKTALEKMFGKPFDFSKLQAPAASDN